MVCAFIRSISSLYRSTIHALSFTNSSMLMFTMTCQRLKSKSNRRKKSTVWLILQNHGPNMVKFALHLTRFISKKKIHVSFFLSV